MGLYEKLLFSMREMFVSIHRDKRISVDDQVVWFTSFCQSILVLSVSLVFVPFLNKDGFLMNYFEYFGLGIFLGLVFFNSKKYEVTIRNNYFREESGDWVDHYIGKKTAFVFIFISVLFFFTALFVRQWLF